ncbi:MAG TPA: hypothetical protein H9900_00920 [Candidatus Monoglobus merdigallinarum]|uniref:Nucleoside transporter/FeoB GTPase Gate domain-containing protein n=1 Tax=Candidatus Monoglobus merdigallinarum TaxID=2838698 RepID=A0A9D1TLQ3_9FIRM|nr:hypothetical protein [Candidatus Monoglobus merdigallinarum]
MMNYIWGGIILLSLIVSVFTGRVEQTAAAAVSGAGSAVDLSLSLLGIMCLWTGISKIGEDAGLIRRIAKILTPPIRFVFPRLDPKGKAFGSVVMNIVANLLGMGNAATPLGIKAVGELKRLSPDPGRATDEMCMLVVLNTASLQLIPTTLISLRQSYGAASPGDVIAPIWICEICALVLGIAAAKFLSRRSRT